MKRISNFTADRMDMNEMAAINGGRGTSFTTNTFTQHGCDLIRSTTSDRWVNSIFGERLEILYTKDEIFRDLCPSLVTIVNPNPDFMEIDKGLVTAGTHPGLFRP